MARTSRPRRAGKGTPCRDLPWRCRSILRPRNTPRTFHRRKIRPLPGSDAGRVVTILLVCGPVVDSPSSPHRMGTRDRHGDVMLAAGLYLFTGFGVAVGLHRSSPTAVSRPTGPEDRSGRGRFDGPRRLHDQLGGHPPPPPHVQRPAGRPPLSHRYGPGRWARSGPRLGPCGLALRHRSHRRPTFAPDLRATPTWSRRPAFPCAGRHLSGHSLFHGLDALRDPGRRLHRLLLGRSDPDGRAPPCDLEHQLHVPSLRS